MASKVFSCDVVLPECDCSENPVRNISSAAPDLPTFTGIAYVSLVPPLGTAWGARNCVGLVISTVSQADADQQAQDAGVRCAIADWRAPAPPGARVTQSPPPSPPVPTRGSTPYNAVGNEPQTQSALCPDGNPFPHTVAAGTFVVAGAFTPAGQAQALLAANAQARSYALRQAQLLKVCLGNILTLTCLNQFYTTTLTATGQNVSGSNPQPFNNSADFWEITSGMVPPGMTFHGGQVFGGSVVINGTPTMAGTFLFTVRITDTAGGQMSKDFQITVAGITNLPAPNGATGAAYSYQLNAVGYNNAGVFSIASGSLPTGLTLSSTGLISGTPTMAQTTSAVVAVTDPDSGSSCSQTVAITVASGNIFDSLVWDNPMEFTFGPSSQDTFFGSVVTFSNGPQAPGSQLQNGNQAIPLSYTGSGLPACNVHLEITNPNNEFFSVVVTQDAAPVLNSNGGGAPTTTYDFPFALIAGANSLIVVTVGIGSGLNQITTTKVVFTAA